MILKDERVSFNVRKQIIYGINQRVVVDVIVRSTNRQRVRLIGYSSTELMRNKNDRDISTVRAYHNALVVATVKYGFPTGSYIEKILNYGFQTPKGITVKRVNLKGHYRTMVYSKGKRGAVKNVKWGVAEDYTRDVAEEFDYTPPDRWRE